MQPMNQILSLIGQYGYLVIFFGVMVESIGVPLPSETILIAAGFLVHQGSLNQGETIMFAVLVPSRVTRSATGLAVRGDVRSSCGGTATSGSPTNASCGWRRCSLDKVEKRCS